MSTSSSASTTTDRSVPVALGSHGGHQSTAPVSADRSFGTVQRVAATCTFVLYVIADSDLTTRAVTNLRQNVSNACSDFQIEVVDVLEAPHRALDHQVYIAPTLIRVCGEQSSRLVGDLSDPDVLIPFLLAG